MILKKLYQRVASHTGFQRYLKNTSWLFGGQMLRMVLGLFVSVAVARHLGPADFGLYNFVLSIVAIVAVFGKLGLDNLLKREFVARPEEREVLMGTAFTLSALAGILVYAGMLLIVGLKSDDSVLIGLFALLGGQILLNPFISFELWFQSQVRSELSVKATSIALIVFSCLKVAAIFQGYGLMTFGFLALLELVFVAGLRAYYYQIYYGKVRSWVATWALAGELLSKSWPLIFSGLATMIYMRIDQVMLGAMLDDRAVGDYAAATRISMVWYFVPTILATSLFPAILNARSKDRAHYEQRLQRFFDLNALLAYVIAVPLSLGAPLIVSILFGAEFEAAGVILAIHAWSSIFVFLGVARGQFFVAEEWFRFSLLCTMLGAVSNIGLNLTLIPNFGGSGAAVATLVSFSISAFFTSFLTSRSREIGIRQVRAACIPFRLKSLIIEQDV